MAKVIVDLQVNHLFHYRDGDFTDPSLTIYHSVELTSQIGKHPKGTMFPSASICGNGILHLNTFDGASEEYVLTYRLA